VQLDQSKFNSGAAVPLIAVLSNPKSTTNAAGMGEIRKVINESANLLHFELDGVETMDEALELFSRANPALIIVNGGDGTIGVALQSLLYRNPFSVTPPIAFLPGGKTNMTAADLGMKGDPIKVLKRLIKLVKAGELSERLTTRNLIELDLDDGNEPKVGTFFGTAGIVKGIYWCRENAYAKGLPNSLAHVWSIFKLVTSAFGFGKDKAMMISDPMNVVVPGKARISGQFASVTATTLDTLILGLKPYSTEGLGGLRFAAVETGGRNVFRALRGIITGKFGKKYIQGVHTRRGDHIRIEGSDPVTLDGEMYTPLAGKPILLKGDKTLTFVKL
jgi:hypothetical protein